MPPIVTTDVNRSSGGGGKWFPPYWLNQMVQCLIFHLEIHLIVQLEDYEHKTLYNFVIWSIQRSNRQETVSVK